MLCLSTTGLGQAASLADQAENQAARNNYQRANELTLEAHSKLRSDYSQERQRVMAEYEAEYELAKKRAQLHSLESEVEVANLELARSQKTQHALTWLAALSLLTVCALVILGLSRSRALARLRVEDKRLASHKSRLEEALDDVATLQGFLPICAYCSRLRSDQETWAFPESFFADRADVTFSKQICTDCSEAQSGPSTTSLQSGSASDA